MTPYPGPRTYNQVRVPRKYTRGKPRFSIYWTWSYPWEANRDVTELDNRFSTMTEVRRVLWPNYETIEYSEKMFLQGIAGTLELFHLGLIRFQEAVGEITGHPVAVYQRIDQAGQKQPLDHGLLDDTDTLMVFGLDHLVTEQEASADEIEALRAWVKERGSSWGRTTTSACRAISRCARWSTSTTATRWCRASSASAGIRDLS